MILIKAKNSITLLIIFMNMLFFSQVTIHSDSNIGT